MHRLAIFLYCLMVASWTANAQDGAAEPPKIPPPVRYIAFSPDSQILGASTFIQDKRGEMAAWRRNDWELKLHYSETVGFPRFAFSPDSQQLVLARLAPELKLLDVTSGEVVGELIGHQGNARGVCYFEHGKKIISGSEDKTIRIWDVESRELIRKFDEHSGGTLDIAVSPDDRRLITADMPESYKVHLWDLNTGKVFHTFGPFRSLISHVSYSNDGRFVTIAVWDGTFQVADGETGEVLRNIRGIAAVNCGAFSPDNRWLAVATFGSELYIFEGVVDPDEATQSKIRQLIAQLDDNSYAQREEASRQLTAVGAAAISALRASQSSESPEVRWRTRRILQRLDGPKSATVLRGHQTQVNCVCFSPDGELLASGDKDGVIKVWNVRDWTEVKTLNIPWRNLPAE